MTQKKKKPARRRKPPASVPDLDQRIKDAKEVSQPDPEIITSDNKSAEVESVLHPEHAAGIEAAMKGKGAGMYASLRDMQLDVAQMTLMDGGTLHELFIKQLEWSCLQGTKAANDALKLIHDPETSEAAKEVLIGRLPKFAIFLQAVSRQRLEILKAGFIDSSLPKAAQDPAELSLEDWEKQYGGQLMLSAGSKQ